MADKLSTNEMLRLACYYAERDQLAFLDSIANCTGEDYAEIRKETERFIRQIHAYRMKRWGKTEGERIEDGLGSVALEELLRCDYRSAFHTGE
jgi:hypothetical protein